MADTPEAPSASVGTSRTTCAVVGGGPAGLVLGLLLARAGVRVTVLEKHADFLRDFRGDTVHPTTLAMLDDLGLFDRFDALPQSHLKQAAFTFPDGRQVPVADFGRLPLRHPYIAMVPQWDLLNLLAEAAETEPTFTLRTEHEVTGVVREGGRVSGVDYDSPEGPGRLHADLVVACDGRWSAVRRAVDLPSKEFPVDFDVWWYRVPTPRRLAESLLPRMAKGRVIVTIPREGYAQVAYIGRKGTDAALRARGVQALRAETASMMPELAEDVSGIASMDDVKHLDVRMDRLRRWHAPGVLCIGDAAHAMSPVGGVGINLAVQDAVAAARLLARPLARGFLRNSGSRRFLARVQRRRTFPTVAVQAVQRFAHARVIAPALNGEVTEPPRGLLALVRRVPALTALPAAFIGIGPRPERVPVWARRTARQENPARP
ncbi:oxidoreductase [Nocardiopsis terrae]|uniref:2-polyprenyl-6-methoxyphenol hydroxylase-like FAD-dependent oxidoreductase n=1 Tax=Nocardiopsis terrae TaxID=372655 RepID=A0ABR9HH85_9ACTN|nr:FAD-dependent oxidoreductase [Nocardiopsis terrae]MBE1458342.1 2-polyprenyl-6-methoxyphenol hydroxylase-like FAD-dependent oxidoreductase [Nocardiopsis terrae]GHC81029.1 oxidoreductase [Nocardiopsis terrae]